MRIIVSSVVICFGICYPLPLRYLWWPHALYHVRIYSRMQSEVRIAFIVLDLNSAANRWQMGGQSAADNSKAVIDEALVVLF